jgi:hypothetical protein
MRASAQGLRSTGVAHQRTKHQPLTAYKGPPDRTAGVPVRQRQREQGREHQHWSHQTTNPLPDHHQRFGEKAPQRRTPAWRARTCPLVLLLLLFPNPPLVHDRLRPRSRKWNAPTESALGRRPLPGRSGSRTRSAASSRAASIGRIPMARVRRTPPARASRVLEETPLATFFAPLRPLIDRRRDGTN